MFFFPNRKFRPGDVPGNVSKGAPDFCTVYVINKGKVSSAKSASGPPPSKTSIQTQMPSRVRNMSDTVRPPLKPRQFPKGPLL